MKTVSLPPVRVEPQMLEQMQDISNQTGISVYELTRQAVTEFVSRHFPAPAPKPGPTETK